MHDALKDIKTSFLRLFDALYFAWGDTRARYRRSVLGPFWLVLGTAFGVVGLGAIWSVLLHIPKEQFIPTFTVGLITWQLISGCITEASGIFYRSSMLLRNVRIPYTFFVIQLITRQLINFAHNLVVLVIVLLIYTPSYHFQQLELIPAFMLVLGNLTWMCLFIGLMGSRFRDIEPLIATVMPIVFFLSPVLYQPTQLGVREILIWCNPLSYLITLVRQPIMATPVESFVWIAASSMFVVGSAVTLWFFNNKYKRIIFWL